MFKNSKISNKKGLFRNRLINQFFNSPFFTPLDFKRILGYPKIPPLDFKEPIYGMPVTLKKQLITYDKLSFK